MITKNGEYNYIRIIGIIIFIIIITYAVIPFNLIFPKEIKPLPNNITYIKVNQTVYITITPTPDNGVFYVGEFQNGTRKLNRPFTWIHYGATGLKDMWVTVRVYDYLILKSYTWLNVHDSKYYKEFPSSIDKKYLLVFINIEMNDITGKDTRMWLPNRDLFAVQYHGYVYPPVNYPLELYIKELENKYDYNDVNRVKAYGQSVFQHIGDSNTGLIESVRNTYLRGGTSNSEDGYILYEIPVNAEPKDLLVLGNFFSFGSSQWRLS